MVDYSLDCVLLFGFLPQVARLFLIICVWCFVGGVVVMCFVCPWSPCYKVNGNYVFDAVL